MSYYYSLLEQLTTGTDSSLIFFFIIVCVVVIGAVFPMYKILLKDRKQARELEEKKEADRLKHEADRLKHEEKMEAERLKHEAERHTRYIERERVFINVLEKNSTIIAECTAVTSSLKGILQDSNIKHGQTLERVHKRIDEIASDIAENNMMTKVMLNTLGADGFRRGGEVT